MALCVAPGCAAAFSRPPADRMDLLPNEVCLKVNVLKVTNVPKKALNENEYKENYLYVETYTYTKLNSREVANGNELQEFPIIKGMCIMMIYGI